MAVPSWRPNHADSSEVGIPTLNNVPGAYIAVLKAVLVTGWNTRAIAQIDVAAEVATVTTTTAHGYTATYGKLLYVSGAIQAGLNGRVQPLTVGTNTFTYDAPGVPDGSYTTAGMTVKRPGLGWIEAYADALAFKSIFARTAPDATPSMLRVLDSRAAPAATQYARMTMVASATGVDALTEEVPADASIPLWSGGAADATAKPWTIVGDEKRFWMFAPPSSTGPGLLYFFGDPVLLYAGDASGCLLVSHATTGSGSALGGITTTAIRDFSAASYFESMSFQRARSGTVGVRTAQLCGAVGWGVAGPSGSAVVPVTGDYYFKDSVGEFRGRAPGLYVPQGTVPFTAGEVYAFAGMDRRLLCKSVRTSSAGAEGQVFIDVTGPWD